MLQNCFSIILMLIAIFSSPTAIAAECILAGEDNLRQALKVDNVANPTNPINDSKWTDTGIILSASEGLNQKSLQIRVDGLWHVLKKRTWAQFFQDNLDYTTSGTYLKDYADYAAGIVLGSKFLQNDWEDYAPIAGHLPEQTEKTQTSNSLQLTTSSGPHAAQHAELAIPCVLNTCADEESPLSCLQRNSIIDEEKNSASCHLQQGAGLVGIISESLPTDADFLNSGELFFIRMDAKTTDGIAYFNFPLKQSVRGKLYLKALDDTHKHHGGYNIYVAYPNPQAAKSFFSEAVHNAEKTIGYYQDELKSRLLNNIELHHKLAVVVTLYICIISIVFLIGILPFESEVLLQHLIKICLMCALIHPNSINYGIMLADSINIDGNKFANIVTRASLHHDLSYSFSTNSNLHNSMLSIYDKIIDLYTSYNTHVRIWALLGFLPIYIPIIYYIIITTIASIIRGIAIYLIAKFLMSMLLAFSPIVLGMAVFNFTRPIFNNWVKAIISAALLNIMLAIVNGVFIGYLGRYTEGMVNYTICLETPNFLTIFGDAIKFWSPANHDFINHSLTLKKLSGNLLIATLCYKVTAMVPALAAELSTFGHQFMVGIEQSIIAYPIKSWRYYSHYVGSFNPIAISMDAASALVQRSYVHRAIRRNSAFRVIRSASMLRADIVNTAYTAMIDEDGGAD